MSVLACFLAASVPLAVRADVNPGEPVNGLRVTLQAASTSWTVGATVALEATLTNLSDRPFLIDTFGELNGLYRGKHASTILPSCWVLSWDHAPSPGGPRGEHASLEVGQFVLLQPGQSYTKHLTVRLTDVAPDQYRIRLAYAPRAAGPSFTFPEHWEEQHKLVDPMWLGMAFSNPLAIDVTQ